MSKIIIENKQIPYTVTVDYMSTEGKKVSQTIKMKSSGETLKEVEPNSSVSVSAVSKIEVISYEPGCRTLKVLQEGIQSFSLKWD